MIKNIKYVRNVAVFIAVLVTSYGLSAQFINGYFFKYYCKLVKEEHVSEVIGWGFIFLSMSQITIVLPAIVIALCTMKFKFSKPEIWFGAKGSLIFKIVAVFGLLLGGLCGWPA